MMNIAGITAFDNVRDEDQPDRAGIGELLPGSSSVQDLRGPGSLPVAAHLQVGLLQPSQQAEVLDHRPVLRPVQPRQPRPVDLRQPRRRRLATPIRLDQDRPAQSGPRRGVPGRPRPGRPLGPATRKEPRPTRPQRPDPARQAERPLRVVSGPSPARRPRTTKPRRMGTMASGQPQSDHQAPRDRPRGQGHTGQHPPDPLALPTPGNRRPQTTSTSLRLKRPPGLARAACRDEWHVRFRGGPDAAMHRGYPTARGRDHQDRASRSPSPSGDQ